VDEFIETELKRGLSKLSLMNRAHVTFSAPARKHMEAFVKLRDSETAIKDTEDMRGMVKRIGAYCGKIATLLCVADNGVLESYEVDLAKAKRATLLVGWLIDAAADLFESSIVF